jgi:cell division protein FtsQ
MDRDGELVETKEPHKYKELIIVAGEQAPRYITELMTLLDKFSELKSRVTAATHLRSTRWNLRLDNKIDVKLPEKETEKALAYLLELTKHHDLTNQEIMTIDMRLPGQVILRLPSEGAQQKKGKDA